LPECDVQNVTVNRLNVTRLTSFPFNETAYAALATMSAADRAAALGVPGNYSANSTDPSSSSANPLLASPLDALGNATVPPRLGLNADVGFTLETRNPNKVAIDYKYVNVSIIYRGVTVGNTSIPPFTQQAQTNTSVPAELLVLDFPLDIVTGPVMLADLNAGNVPLQLLLQLGARINILGVASPFALVSAHAPSPSLPCNPGELHLWPFLTPPPLHRVYTAFDFSKNPSFFYGAPFTHYC
ncbi:unnamed protein product, partial [Closterium sp. NIES-53]